MWYTKLYCCLTGLAKGREVLGLNTNFLFLGRSAWPSFWCSWKEEREELWEAVVSFMLVPAVILDG